MANIGTSRGEPFPFTLWDPEKVDPLGGATSGRLDDAASGDCCNGGGGDWMAQGNHNLSDDVGGFLIGRQYPARLLAGRCSV